MSDRIQKLIEEQRQLREQQERENQQKQSDWNQFKADLISAVEEFLYADERVQAVIEAANNPDLHEMLWYLGQFNVKKVQKHVQVGTKINKVRKGLKTVNEIEPVYELQTVSRPQKLEVEIHIGHWEVTHIIDAKRSSFEHMQLEEAIEITLTDFWNNNHPFVEVIFFYNEHEAFVTPIFWSINGESANRYLASLPDKWSAPHTRIISPGKVLFGELKKPGLTIGSSQGKFRSEESGFSNINDYLLYLAKFAEQEIAPPKNWSGHPSSDGDR